MGRSSSIIVSLFALALSMVAAAALDAGKIAGINKAAELFVALAKDFGQHRPGASPIGSCRQATTRHHIRHD